MSTKDLPAPASRLTAGDDELDHIYCCDPNRGLCGADLSDVTDIVGDWDDENDPCIVCADLERVGARCCPTCTKSRR
ncbi:hypothetical protein [Streptomyces coffeae]|uniref:Uncharacterized protein n=1 Tax=Streptomyces coffeae TaxID=621382 RepID=A0ABS1NNQ3_9ACTN|nr:hypothetical protein [Streptomyces coffeae]MBL1101717.1 hypothetical protein [Streptomyces coffeae]